MKKIFLIFLICLIPFYLQSQGVAGMVIGSGSGGGGTFPTTGIVDNFNRSNEGPPPSSSWANITNGLKVVSNQCVGNSSGDWNRSYYNTDYGPDCEVYLKLVNVAAYVGLFARYAVAGNGYSMYVEAANTIRVYKVTGGSETKIGSDITLGTNLAAGDLIGMEIIGNSIKVYTKQGAGSWTQRGNTITDTTYSSAGKIGASVYGSSQAIDDFGGGTHTL